MFVQSRLGLVSGRGIEQIKPRIGSVLVPKGGSLTLDWIHKMVNVPAAYSS